jgi:polyphosphate kinase
MEKTAENAPQTKPVTPETTASKPTRKKAVTTRRSPGRKTAARGKARAAFNLDAPELYLNRELTWLEFNRRVLHMAEDENTPLLERVKFLAIVSNNLDEFLMKRIGGLKQQIAAGIRTPTVDGRTPAEQVQECHVVVRCSGSSNSTASG